MRLLVSVGNAEEAAAAVAGGADIVDAKDPLRGALGAVSREQLAAIARAVGGARPLSAALGDAGDDASVGCLAGEFAAAGVDLVKVGLAGTGDCERAAALLSSAATAAGRDRVVAVAYADHERVSSLPPAEVLRLAAALGLAGVLFDTADKAGPGLCGLAPPSTIAGWIDAAHRARLFVALAGRLTAEDVAVLRGTRADILGVRGAACDGGRAGAVSTVRVRILHALVHPPPLGLTPVRSASGV